MFTLEWVYRDVVVEMSHKGVEDIRDFNWESQLRYYWEFNELPPSGVHPQETIMVRDALVQHWHQDITHCCP